MGYDSYNKIYHNNEIEGNCQQEMNQIMMWNDLKIPNDSGDVLKTEWSGWQYDSWP